MEVDNNLFEKEAEDGGEEEEPDFDWKLKQVIW
jgi:hypothetical protein